MTPFSRQEILALRKIIDFGNVVLIPVVLNVAINPTDPKTPGFVAIASPDDEELNCFFYPLENIHHRTIHQLLITLTAMGAEAHYPDRRTIQGKEVVNNGWSKSVSIEEFFLSLFDPGNPPERFPTCYAPSLDYWFDMDYDIIHRIKLHAKELERSLCKDVELDPTNSSTELTENDFSVSIRYSAADKSPPTDPSLQQ